MTQPKPLDMSKVPICECWGPSYQYVCVDGDKDTCRLYPILMHPPELDLDGNVIPEDV